jgi:protein-L-isoaspartate(D-aspartate) O-methyltransferase
MDLTRRRMVIRLMAVCLTGIAILVFVVGGGWWIWQSDNSQADPPQPSEQPVATAPPPGQDEGASDSEYVEARRRMVAVDLAGRDITDAKVLKAMGEVPRHRFVSRTLRDQAYRDHPLPIGHGQTISQPYIVALMTQLVRPKPGGRVLDVGTGSGYQAAVLAELAGEVYSIEIVEPLADEAKKRLAELGYENVTVRAGDGYKGWPEKAPFDAVVVAAAPDHVPQPLVDQLAPGGRMVIPVGRFYQELLLLEKGADGKVQRKSILPVMFVPMTGEAERRNP